MNFNLDTILKAIELVGETSAAAKQIFEGFIAVTGGETQENLKARYAAARAKSDGDHTALQDELGG
jgi:hypothetical protein